MGQRDNFSTSDVAKINKMYQCGNIDIIDPHYPGVSNNIDEFGDDNETGTNTSNNSSPPNRPNRPNRPIVDFFSGLFSGK